MVKSKAILGLLLFVICAGFAQTNRYIVSFKDKNGSPFSISQPLQFLSQKAIDRREKQGIPLNEEDIPVNAEYVSQVQSTGAHTFYTSRWLNCVLVETDAVTLDQIRLLPSVKTVEFVAPNAKLSTGRVRKITNKKGISAASATRTQLQMIGVDKMQEDGFRGEGITIGIFDSGFLGVNETTPFQPIFQENRLVDSYNFVGGSGNVFLYDDHGTEVLSVIGAFSPDVFTGGAYKASFQLYVTEDVSSEYRVEEYNWLFAAERADSAGVDVINSSLGYNLFDDAAMNYKKSELDGKTAVISRAASMAIARGIVVVCSAGNEGSNSWQVITPPADVNGILATGSVTSALSKSSFSSIGPTSDNRLKPDVMALGSSTSVIKPSGTLGTESGTSLASPLICSLAAGVLQAYPQLTVSEIYNSIIESASQYSNPDNFKGYGIPNYNMIKYNLETLDMEDEIAMYPNPVTVSSLKIAIKHPTVGRVRVLIVSSEGKKLLDSSVEVDHKNNPLEFDLSSLASGNYYVKVTVGENLKTIRLVKS